MRSTVVRTLYWSYWANIFYILGMFGYLTIDTLTFLHPKLNNTLSLLIYIFLSIIFVIDAILYTIDWYMYAVKLREHENDPIEYRTELVACIFLHLGSYFYFVSSLLYLKTTDPPLGTILLMNFLGIIAFLCEACLTFLGWRITLRKYPSADPKRGCVPQDVYLWAHLMNFIAGLVYLCATTLAYRLYLNSKIIHPNGVLILQMFGDLLYLFDAYLYYDGWKRDKEEFDADVKQKKLMELNLVKQLTIDNIQ